jgi:ATP-dependent DNA helicase RecQ
LDSYRSIHEVLYQFWGFRDFRPLQEEIIYSIMRGQDTLAILPTGAGKSICYQVPGIYLEGIAIVISPLIALMKDQVYQLKGRGVQAEAIFSGMPYREIDRILDNCIYGHVKILYISPERLQTELTRERIKQMQMSFVAVDEAHCISQWGYDFRPAYLKIATIREWHPKVPFLALTATATREVQLDIETKLGFPASHVISGSLTRPNLVFVAEKTVNKYDRLLEVIEGVQGSGIVYVRSRRRTKSLAQFLTQRNITAEAYHAGMEISIRHDVQQAWLDNKTRVICATNAFGMGIDKADVRFVIHMDLPPSIEEYYQEAGRAGRDEKKAFAVLLYNEADVEKLKVSFKVNFPEMAEIRLMYRALAHQYQLAVGSRSDESYDFDLTEFCERYRFKPIPALNGLKLLEQAGWITLTEAVFQSSRVQIVVAKDRLYEYRVKHAESDLLLKALLRSYEGIFQIPVSINEFKIGKVLKLPSETIASLLYQMERDGIIKYTPQKDKAQVLFNTERSWSNHVSIDKKMYLFRKERYYHKINAVISYLDEKRCRTVFLLKYFDQRHKLERCGICDLCLKQKGSGHLKDQIIEFLKDGERTPEDLLREFSQLTSRQQVTRLLDELEQTGVISHHEGKLSLST